MFYIHRHSRKGILLVCLIAQLFCTLRWYNIDTIKILWDIHAQFGVSTLEFDRWHEDTHISLQHKLVDYCRVTILCNHIEWLMPCGRKDAKYWHWHCKAGLVRWFSLLFLVTSVMHFLFLYLNFLHVYCIIHRFLELTYTLVCSIFLWLPIWDYILLVVLENSSGTLVLKDVGDMLYTVALK